MHVKDMLKVSCETFNARPNENICWQLSPLVVSAQVPVPDRDDKSQSIIFYNALRTGT